MPFGTLYPRDKINLIMKRLLIIDGNAILHRAYHALPPLTNSRGEIVNAVYGFFSMLLNVLVDQKPDYLVICFDRPGPNFRQNLFAGYQQHRPKVADDFVPQIILVHDLLEKMKVVVFELDGYEADDLIGTIANQAIVRGPVSLYPRPTASFTTFSPGARRGSPKLATPPMRNKLSENNQPVATNVVILSGDRDMLQLVNKHVKVLMPLVGITKTALFGNKEVEDKYGVKTSQFIDYKALIGDASDGYPGVAGIGPKTASSLLQKYGTFENLYEHVGELPEKIGLKLATDAEQAALAKKLATIVTDAPIQFKIEECVVEKIDVKGVLAGFKEQGFKSLTARFEKVFGEQEIEMHEKDKDGQMGIF